MAREPRSGKDSSQGNSPNRIAVQEKRLIVLCIIVAFIMLLSLSRYVFK